MKKKITISLIILAVIVAGIAIYFTQKPKEPETIKIGAILPLTGPLAFFGEPEKDVLLMAQEEINSKGGVKGKRVELIIEDSKSSSKNGVSALQKVLLQKPVAVVTSLTIISNATQPILKGQQIPQIALSVHPTIAKQSEFTIRPYYGFEDEMKVIVDYLKKKNYKKVGILWVNVPECEIAINEVLVPALKEIGGTVVASENYSIGELNIKSQLTKIAAKKPEAILAMDFGNLMGIILKETKNLGIREKIIGGIGLFYAPPIEPDLLEGIPFAGPSFIIKNYETFKEFEKKFVERTGKKPSYDVLYTYDAFNLLVEGISRGGTNPKSIIASIISLKEFNGVTGLMKIQPDGNVNVEISMGYYQNGEMKPLKY